MKAKDIRPGLRKGRITIVKKVPKPEHLKSKGTYWLYRCDCGSEKIAHSATVWRTLMSCGCIGKEKKYKTKDTLHYRYLYCVWKQMLSRCENPDNKNWAHYGQRGITVSNAWHDFGHFYNDMIDTYRRGLTIERIDIDGNYCKENCKWITNEDQAKNRRSSLHYRQSTGYDWPYAKRNV